MPLIEYIVSTIAPHECLRCGAENTVLCTACSAGLVRVPERCYRCLTNNLGHKTCKSCRAGSTLHAVYPVTMYEGVAKDLIHALKFERSQASADVVANLLAERLPELGGIVITHVPTATSRIRMRGYDQAALIARRLATQLGVEYVPLLSRLGQQRQVGKNRSERRNQMQELFIATKKQPPKHVLLIDDVITTGATLEACARILKNAGVKRVSAAVFAAA